MRRTGNDPSSPTIGIVIAGTEKIGFKPVCAAAGALRVAALASASAPDERMVLRSTVFMAFSWFPDLLLRRPYLDRHTVDGKQGCHCGVASNRLPFGTANISPKRE